MWTQSNVEIRLISLGWAGDPVTVKKPFMATIANDACARSSERWMIQSENAWGDPVGPVATYPWYAVITPDDTAKTRFTKYDFARKVRAAQEELRAAEQKLRNLTN